MLSSSSAMEDNQLRVDAAVGAVESPIDRSRFFPGESVDLQASKTAVSDALFCFMSPRISCALVDPVEEQEDTTPFALGTVGGLLSAFRCSEGLLETNNSRFCRRSLRISWALVVGGGAAIMVAIGQI